MSSVANLIMHDKLDETIDSSKGHDLAPWSISTASPHELYVDIFIVDDNRHKRFITNKFPMSLLLRYSSLARNHLLVGSEHQGRKDDGACVWRIPVISTTDDDVDAWHMVLMWIVGTLPAKSFGADYSGHPQLDNRRTFFWRFGFRILTRCLVAMSTLQLVSPLNRQRVIPSILAADMHRIDVSTALAFFLLIDSPYQSLARSALEVAAKKFKDDNDMRQARLRDAKLESAMSDTESHQEKST